MTILLSILLMFMVQSTGEEDSSAAQSPPMPAGMVWVDGGEFTMGGVGSEVRPDELPRHRVRLDGFFISETEVTNRQFKAFIEATGYQTVAERAVDWEEIRKQVPPGTPKPPDEVLQPGSLVFNETGKPVDPRDVSQWWNWTIGANWRHPEGPGSSIDDRLDHPVVQVAWEDAVAYADWAGGALPTEAQWEYAARGGLADQPFIWGDQQIDVGRANTWQGDFPIRNTGADGHLRTAAVKSFPPNGHGLYDMGGNVWEWCRDRYRSDAYVIRIRETGADGVTVNPQGPTSTADPRQPHAQDTRVQRGGSFLCNPSYCSSYRPSARMSATPDSGMSHAGFRIVMTPEQAGKATPRKKVSAP